MSDVARTDLVTDELYALDVQFISDDDKYFPFEVRYRAQRTQYPPTPQPSHCSSERLKKAILFILLILVLKALQKSIHSMHFVTNRDVWLCTTGRLADATPKLPVVLPSNHLSLPPSLIVYCQRSIPTSSPRCPYGEKYHMKPCTT